MKKRFQIILAVILLSVMACQQSPRPSTVMEVLQQIPNEISSTGGNTKDILNKFNFLLGGFGNVEFEKGDPNDRSRNAMINTHGELITFEKHRFQLNNNKEHLDGIPANLVIEIDDLSGQVIGITICAITVMPVSDSLLQAYNDCGFNKVKDHFYYESVREHYYEEGMNEEEFLNAIPKSVHPEMYIFIMDSFDDKKKKSDY